MVVIGNSEIERALYCLVGESVCAVQHVEDALSHSIILKMTKPQLKSEADQLLVSICLGRGLKYISIILNDVI